jgi:hypothetical protein
MHRGWWVMTHETRTCTSDRFKAWRAQIEHGAQFFAWLPRAATLEVVPTRNFSTLSQDAATHK